MLVQHLKLFLLLTKLVQFNKLNPHLPIPIAYLGLRKTLPQKQINYARNHKTQGKNLTCGSQEFIQSIKQWNMLVRLNKF